MTTFNPLEYISVLRRKKFIFIGIFSVLFAMSFFFALNWSKYKAYATVEVARPEISLEALETEASSAPSAEALADLKISRLKQTVLSNRSLGEIITDLDLYPESRQGTRIAYLAQAMREKIDISLVSTALANPASAQKASALQLSAIAFVISFEYSDPLKAQKTVNELVTRFLDQDLEERRKTAQATSDFLQGQIDMLEDTLEEQEKKIAEFRAENGGMRADALAFNQQASVTTTSRLLAIESEIVSNLGVIGALRAQLAQTEPYAVVVGEDGDTLTTPTTQLRGLQSQYATLSSKYGAEHPDVLKTLRQIEALERQIGGTSQTARIRANITDVRTRLQTMEDTYGPDHPDVQSLRSQLDNLNTQLRTAARTTTAGSSNRIQRDADNPAYLNIVAQLDAAQQQQNALIQQRDAIEGKQAGFEKAIEANPEAEQRFAALTRDYDNMMMLYRELTAKKLASDMNKTIEEGHSGHRLAVINPPELPRSTNPSKKLILVAGFIFSLMTALATVLGLQLLSSTVLGPKHLESITGLSPLVRVPTLYSYDNKIQLMKWARKGVYLLPIIIIILLIVFFTAVMPFDVFGSILGRKIGLEI